MPDLSKQLSDEVKELSSAVSSLVGVVGTLRGNMTGLSEGTDEYSNVLEYVSQLMKKNADEQAKIEAKKRTDAEKAAADRKKANDAQRQFEEMSARQQQKFLKFNNKKAKEEEKELERAQKAFKLNGDLNNQIYKQNQKKLNELKVEQKHRKELLKEYGLYTQAMSKYRESMSALQETKVGKGLTWLSGMLGGLLGGATAAGGILYILNSSDKSFKNIARAAGVSVSAGGSMEKAFQNSQKSLLLMGYSLEEQGEIGESLVQTFGSIGAVSEESMKMTGALAREMGVSIGEAAESLKTLSVTMGLGVEQVDAFASALRNQATAAGIPASLVMRDLAGFAKDTTRSFGMAPNQLKNATIRARQLGTTIDKMAEAGQNFETVESSLGIAQQASLLFGSKLNAIELTRLSRAGKFEQLQDRVLDSLESQIDEQGNIRINDVAQAKLLEQMLGSNWKEIIKARKLEQRISKLGLKTDEEKAAALQLAMKDTKLLNKENKASLLSQIGNLVKQNQEAESIKETSLQYQSAMDQISNTLKSIIVPFISAFGEGLRTSLGQTGNLKDTFISVATTLGDILGKAVSWVTETERVQRITSVMSTGFEVVKSVLDKIKSIIEFMEANPTMTKLLGIGAAAVGVAAIGRALVKGQLGSGPGNPMYVTGGGIGGAAVAAGSEVADADGTGGGGEGGGENKKPKPKRSLKTKYLRTMVHGRRAMRSPGKTAGNALGGLWKMLKGAGPKMLTGLKTIFTGAMGKGFLKKVPLLGLLFSLYDMVDRFAKGDYLGAGLEFVAAVASLFPGIGTGVSVGISALNVARDLKSGGKGVVEDGSDAAMAAAGKGFSGGLNILPFGKGGPIPKSGKKITKPTVAVMGETGEDEIVLPTEALRNGGPVDPFVKQELKSLPPDVWGGPKIFASMGFSSGGGGESQASISSKSAVLATERAATALETSAGDSLAAERRLAKSIDHATAMQNKQAKLQLDINELQLKKEKSRFRIDDKLLSAIGRHMEATEEFINENGEMMDAMGGLGGFLKNNSKLIGDVGRFLQMSDKKAAAIGIAANTLSAGIDNLLLGSGKDGKGPSEFAKAVSVGMNAGISKFSQELQKGTDPTIAGLKGLASGLRANRNQRKKAEKNVQVYNQMLDTLIDGGMDQTEAQKVLAEKLVMTDEGRKMLQDAMAANTEATEKNTGKKEKEKPKGPGPLEKGFLEFKKTMSNPEAIKQAIKDGAAEQGAQFAEGTAALMESGMSFKEAAKAQLKNQAKEAAMGAANKGFDIAAGALAAAAGPFAPLVEMLAPMIKQFLPAIIKWLGKNWKKLPGMIAKFFKKIPGLILSGLKMFFKIHIFILKAFVAGLKMLGKIHIFILKAFVSIVKKAFKLLPKLLIGAVLFAILGPFLLVAVAIKKFFPNLGKKLFSAFIKGLKMFFKIHVFILKAIVNGLRFFFNIHVFIFKAFVSIVKKAFKLLPKLLVGALLAALLGPFLLVAVVIKKFFPGLGKKLVRIFKKGVRLAFRAFTFLPRKIFGVFKKIWKGIKKVVPGLAKGAVITKPTTAMIGETGEKEVVVPVERIRNGGQVDPAVMAEMRSIAPLIGGGVQSETNSTTAQTGSNEALINEIRALRAEISSIANRPITITMDGKKVADNVGERFHRTAHRY